MSTLIIFALIGTTIISENMDQFILQHAADTGPA